MDEDDKAMAAGLKGATNMIEGMGNLAMKMEAAGCEPAFDGPSMNGMKPNSDDMEMAAGIQGATNMIEGMGNLAMKMQAAGFKPDDSF